MSHDIPPHDTPAYPTDCEVLAGYRYRADARRLPSSLPEPLRARAAAIRLVLFDVDGVLSDGSIIYTESGGEAKSFCTQDGLGINLLHRAAIRTGLITARRSDIVRRRAEELGMEYLLQGVEKKLDAFRDILQRSGCKPFEVCYMGDDWIDLPLLTRVGLAACPANAVPEVRSACHVQTTRQGGSGAVRELCDLIITAKGIKETLLQQFS